MKLIKVTKSGSLHFELSDGRIGVSYSSGYVRVSTFSTGPHRRMYQINKQIIKLGHFPYSVISRVLIPLQNDRLIHLMNFNNRNCK